MNRKGTTTLGHGRNTRRHQWLGLLVLAVGAVCYYGAMRHGGRTGEPLPPFADMTDAARKAAFLAWLGPLVTEANTAVRADRERLEVLRARFATGALSRGEIAWLHQQADRYRLGSGRPLTAGLLAELSARMDEIPPALALAQAALESGWGTSRLAREANNLFGITAQPGTAAYRSPLQSVHAYFLLLNSHPAYEPFRQLRQQARVEGLPLSGADLAAGLLRYSEEGPLYIAKVRRLIHTNALEPEPVELALQ